jgi:hypothetical protein
MTSLRVLVLLAAAANSTGDPLALVHRLAGQTRVECSGALETVMLLAQLAAPSPEGAPPPTGFQTQARARFALQSNHPAVQETAALMGHGFGLPELARLSTMMSPAPYFTLIESPEVKQLAASLPSANGEFNLDRLYGYSKLVREFYWDNHVGQFLRSSTPYYQQVVKRPLPPDLPPGARILLSPLAPAARIEFTRQIPKPVTYLVLGG